ncbi:hypothetical protein [Borreliella burgdorferi]|nr:hypothetical protein [Borreliella burgdorferi]
MDDIKKDGKISATVIVLRGLDMESLLLLFDYAKNTKSTINNR